jgi:threonine dehydrogenase-like Zn-dependent dehydrogenase
MKATVPGSGSLQLVKHPEPELSTPAEVKRTVTRVGISGTDRFGV